MIRIGNTNFLFIISPEMMFLSSGEIFHILELCIELDSKFDTPIHIGIWYVYSIVGNIFSKFRVDMWFERDELVFFKRIYDLLLNK